MASNLPLQKLRLIGGTFLFERIDEIFMERIVSDRRCRLEQFDKGQTIFDETHFRRCLGIILSGTVRVDKLTPEGRPMKMASLGPGECFGAAGMFVRRSRYPSVLTAQSPAEVLFLPETLIRWAMQRDFTITENYIRYLSGRVWFLSEKIVGLSAGSAEQRVARFLLEQPEEDRGTSSMTDLARQLNMGRASLYRSLDALSERGLIRRTGRMVEIPDREALEAVVRGDP